MSYPNAQGTAVIDGSVGAGPTLSTLPVAGFRTVPTADGLVALPLIGYVQLQDGQALSVSEVTAGHILMGEMSVTERTQSTHRGVSYDVYLPRTKLPMRVVVLSSAASSSVSGFVPKVYPTLQDVPATLPQCACVEEYVPTCDDAVSISPTTSFV